MPEIILADDPLSAATLRDGLLAESYAVRLAASRQEAVDAAVERPPDLLLVDFALAPYADGINASDEIRSCGPNARVMLMTDYFPSEIVEEHAARLGIEPVLYKLLDPDEVVRAVKDALAPL